MVFPIINPLEGIAQPVKVNLGAIQETLLIPLYARAQEAKCRNPLFRDPKSVEMVEKLEYGFRRFDAAVNVLRDVVIRTELLDHLVSQFLDRHPSGQVINLGAGLDTRFIRLDNGLVHWVDVDMPDATELREKFLPPSERNRVIGRSMFDYEWIDEIFRISPWQTLLLAEGLFMYFQPDEIRYLFQTLATRFPGAELIFQSTSPDFVGRKRQVPGVRETPATFGWGINHGRQVEEFDPNIRFIDEWYLIDRHRSRWGNLRYLTLMPPVRNYVRRSMKFTRVKFDFEQRK